MPFKYLICEGKLSWLVRVFHCGITFGIIGSFIFTDSILYNIFINKKDLFYGFAFLLIHFVTLVLYITVSYMDPGYASEKLNETTHQEDKFSSDESEIDNTENDLSPMFRKYSKKNIQSHNNFIVHKHCLVCGIEQPLRCRHCNDCNKCVLKYDHHCPWIDNCIGEYNHPVFLIFLVFELIAVLWTIYWSCISIKSSTEWLMWLRINAFFLLNVVICILGCIPLICLLIFHVYLAFTNSTTWEIAAREKITYLKKLSFNVNPFHQGYFKNVAQFCCRYDYPKQWEVIYKKNLNDMNLEGLKDDDEAHHVLFKKEKICNENT